LDVNFWKHWQEIAAAKTAKTHKNADKKAGRFLIDSFLRKKLIDFAQDFAYLKQKTPTATVCPLK
jgi:hypothetical protein